MAQAAVDQQRLVAGLVAGLVAQEPLPLAAQVCMDTAAVVAVMGLPVLGQTAGVTLAFLAARTLAVAEALGQPLEVVAIV